MFGAALATSLGYIVGALMILIYLMQPHRVLHLCKVKLSSKSLRLTLRNTGYMCKLGLSSFLCEAAIATMMFTGNYVFIHYLGEDGVAAYSIACYFFPIIFMVYNAIAQSAQPILSYNFGAGNPERVRAAFRLALLTAISCGVVVFAVTTLFSAQITSWFIDSSYPAHDLAVKRTSPVLLPASCASASTLYPSAISRVWNATVRPWPFTLLRGFIPHPVLFLADAHPVGSTGNLAGCPRFRTADLSFCHYHLLSQETKLKIYYLCACINAEKYESFY